VRPKLGAPRTVRIAIPVANGPTSSRGVPGSIRNDLWQCITVWRHVMFSARESVKSFNRESHVHSLDHETRCTYFWYDVRGLTTGVSCHSQNASHSLRKPASCHNRMSVNSELAGVSRAFPEKWLAAFDIRFIRIGAEFTAYSMEHDDSFIATSLLATLRD
jgi:hypothetical protein